MKTLLDTYLEVFNSIDFEKIKDHPNILIAANFWDEDRYRAARTCYKFMRAIDDMIDDHKSTGKKVTAYEAAFFEQKVKEWIGMIYSGGNKDPFHKELSDTIREFHIPSWPLEAFARSMVYDIHHDGFPTIDSFIDYAGGASVAPAAIFVHLAGLNKKDGVYASPAFEVKDSARSCAMFSYLVHIIRDFQKDQLNNLNYFADDVMAENGLTREKLRDIAKGDTVTEGFRNMMREYHRLADSYRILTIDCINSIWPCLGARYQLSLEIIFELYLMVFERIDPDRGGFLTDELNPTPLESRERVYRRIFSSRTLR